MEATRVEHPKGDSVAATDPIDVAGVVRALVAYWRPIVMAVVVGLVAGFTVAQNLSVSYKATSAISAIRPDQLNATDVASALDRLSTAYAESVVGEPVLGAVIAKLELATSTSELRQRVSVQTTPGSDLILISVIDTDAGRAADVAGAIADQVVQAAATSQQVNAAMAFVRTQIDDISAQISADETQLDSLRRQLDLAPNPQARATIDKQISTLEQRVSAWQTNTASLQQLLAQPTPSSSVVERPRREDVERVQPSRMLWALGGGLAALTAAGAGAYVLEQRRARERHRIASGAVVVLPELGVVPASALDVPPQAVAGAEPLGPIASCYSEIFAMLKLEARDAPISSILVVGLPGIDDASVIAADLAATLAASGSRTAIVDGDLRRPRQHELFDTDLEPGLSDAITRSERGAVEHAHTTTIPNLELVTAGRLTTNPSMLIARHGIDGFLERLLRGVDVVVVAGPSSVHRTDVLTLARGMDVVVLVAGLGDPGVADDPLVAELPRTAQFIGVVYVDRPTPSRPPIPAEAESPTLAHHLRPLA